MARYVVDGSTLKSISSAHDSMAWQRHYILTPNPPHYSLSRHSIPQTLRPSISHKTHIHSGYETLNRTYTTQSYSHTTVECLRLTPAPTSTGNGIHHVDRCSLQICFSCRPIVVAALAGCGRTTRWGPDVEQGFSWGIGCVQLSYWWRWWWLRVI